MGRSPLTGTVLTERLNRIKDALVRKGVSQKELAEKLSTNEHTISNWYVNNSQPHLKELRKLAKILGLDICDLLVSNKEK